MKKKTIAIIATPVILVTIVIFVVACFPIFYYGNMLTVIAFGIKPTESQIVGTYVANTNYGEAHLLVRADHTFSETVVPKNQVPTTVSGTWKPLNFGTVGFGTQFFPYIGVLHDRFEQYSYGTPVFEKNVLGHISIEEDPDWGIYFYKDGKR